VRFDKMPPPHGDYTERIPQRWHILAPRLRKIRRLIRDDSITYDISSPTEFLFNDKNSWDAWSKLAVPGALARRAAPRSLSRKTRRTSQLSSLESLPPELLASIMEDSMLEKRDLIALALASSTLWAHVLSHVEKECSLAKPSLAGVELACIGTYLTDLPELFAQNDLAKSSVPAWYVEYMCEARRINWAAVSVYGAIEETAETAEERWKAAWKSAKADLLVGFDGRLAGKLGAEFAGKCDTIRGEGPDALWVLRNLTTREFVRCMPGKGPGGIRGYVDCGDRRIKVRVDDVLLLRICWTKVTDWGNRESLGIYRGKWAGHCFDIVPWGRLDGEEGWRDCTEEVVEQAKEVLEKMLPLGTAGLTMLE
jgi:hypothetical protein